MSDNKVGINLDLIQKFVEQQKASQTSAEGASNAAEQTQQTNNINPLISFDSDKDSFLSIEETISFFSKEENEEKKTAFEEKYGYKLSDLSEGKVDELTYIADFIEFQTNEETKKTGEEEQIEISLERADLEAYIEETLVKEGVDLSTKEGYLQYQGILEKAAKKLQSAKSGLTTYGNSAPAFEIPEGTYIFNTGSSKDKKNRYDTRTEILRSLYGEPLTLNGKDLNRQNHFDTLMALNNISTTRGGMDHTFVPSYTNIMVYSLEDVAKVTELANGDYSIENVRRLAEENGIKPLSETDRANLEASIKIAELEEVKPEPQIEEPVEEIIEEIVEEAVEVTSQNADTDVDGEIEVDEVQAVIDEAGVTEEYSGVTEEGKTVVEVAAGTAEILSEVGEGLDELVVTADALEVTNVVQDTATITNKGELTEILIAGSDNIQGTNDDISAKFKDFLSKHPEYTAENVYPAIETFVGTMRELYKNSPEILEKLGNYKDLVFENLVELNNGVKVAQVNAQTGVDEQGEAITEQVGSYAESSDGATFITNALYKIVDGKDIEVVLDGDTWVLSGKGIDFTTLQFDGLLPEGFEQTEYFNKMLEGFFDEDEQVSIQLQRTGGEEDLKAEDLRFTFTSGDKKITFEPSKDVPTGAEIIEAQGITHKDFANYFLDGSEYLRLEFIMNMTRLEQGEVTQGAKFGDAQVQEEAIVVVKDGKYNAMTRAEFEALKIKEQYQNTDSVGNIFYNEKEETAFFTVNDKLHFRGKDSVIVDMQQFINNRGFESEISNVNIDENGTVTFKSNNVEYVVQNDNTIISKTQLAIEKEYPKANISHVTHLANGNVTFKKDGVDMIFDKYGNYINPTENVQYLEDELVQISFIGTDYNKMLLEGKIPSNLLGNNDLYWSNAISALFEEGELETLAISTTQPQQFTLKSKDKEITLIPNESNMLEISQASNLSWGEYVNFLGGNVLNMTPDVVRELHPEATISPKAINDNFINANAIVTIKDGKLNVITSEEVEILSQYPDIDLNTVKYFENGTTAFIKDDHIFAKDINGKFVDKTAEIQAQYSNASNIVLNNDGNISFTSNDKEYLFRNNIVISTAQLQFEEKYPDSLISDVTHLANGNVTFKKDGVDMMLDKHGNYINVSESVQYLEDGSIQISFDELSYRDLKRNDYLPESLFENFDINWTDAFGALFEEGELETLTIANSEPQQFVLKGGDKEVILSSTTNDADVLDIVQAKNITWAEYSSFFGGSPYDVTIEEIYNTNFEALSISQNALNDDLINPNAIITFENGELSILTPEEVEILSRYPDVILNTVQYGENDTISFLDGENIIIRDKDGNYTDKTAQIKERYENASDIKLNDDNTITFKSNDREYLLDSTGKITSVAELKILEQYSDAKEIAFDGKNGATFTLNNVKYIMNDDYVISKATLGVSIAEADRTPESPTLPIVAEIAGAEKMDATGTVEANTEEKPIIPTTIATTIEVDEDLQNDEEFALPKITTPLSYFARTMTVDPEDNPLLTQRMLDAAKAGQAVQGPVQQFTIKETEVELPEGEDAVEIVDGQEGVMATVIASNYTEAPVAMNTKLSQTEDGFEAELADGEDSLVLSGDDIDYDTLMALGYIPMGEESSFNINYFDRPLNFIFKDEATILNIQTFNSKTLTGEEEFTIESVTTPGKFITLKPSRESKTGAIISNAQNITWAEFATYVTGESADLKYKALLSEGGYTLSSEGIPEDCQRTFLGFSTGQIKENAKVTIINDVVYIDMPKDE